MKSTKAEKGSKKTAPIKASAATRSPWLLVAASVAILAVACYFLIPMVRNLSYHSYRLSARNKVDKLRWNVTCNSADYEPVVPGCSPRQCGRLVFDGLLSHKDFLLISNIAKGIFALTPGGSGGPTIFDVHSGALSYGDKFVDAYKLLQQGQIATQPFGMEEIEAVERLVSTIATQIEREFGLEAGKIGLTSPSFFSKIRGDLTPKTENDEYWHEHVDRVAYGSFTYTSLLYLSTFGEDFSGGEFSFVDSTDQTPTRYHTVEPAKGRVSIFTSGYENVHFVHKVQSGLRYAFTIAFTCTPDKAIPNFLHKAKATLQPVDPAKVPRSVTS